MKTEKQSSEERLLLCRLIQNMTITMLTTLDHQGKLVSRPMTPLLLDADAALWFFTDSRTEKVKHRDAINLSFIDSARASYVSLSGRGEIYTQRLFIDRLWTPFAKPWLAGGRDSPHLALLKFVPERAEYWDSGEARMVQIQIQNANHVVDTFEYDRKTESA